MIKKTNFDDECVICNEKISIYLESNDDSLDTGEMKKQMLSDFKAKCSKCNKIII